MPLRQVGIDKDLQRVFLREDFFAQARDLLAGLLQGFFDQFFLGFEVRVETAMGQAQGFHQRLQAGGADTVLAKSGGSFLDDALMGLGFVIWRVTHVELSATMLPS